MSKIILDNKYNKEVTKEVNNHHNKVQFSKLLEEEMMQRIKVLGNNGTDEEIISQIKLKVTSYRKPTVNEVWFVLNNDDGSKTHLVGVDFSKMKILRIINKK